ncbi:MAG: hypothetical protein A3C02_02310 [Candidatus Andersenbacteria bacterium RIFCSPHIGHO2_02_FULL_45_11]|uniref:Large ribosomal subunit protein bL25 n=1 Tax=Candidatus Andersenbacteria bacterium RIFCSPHIGHO2_12_FULL_45_11 TaxID=1797281 RepID=A0A1G1X3R2_9BACT|nr:MAG: hypothetical protein A2805_01740 [Candidatus Andersenbacteria bacterium RIFCSPHIGHO2_01_FULL_46_36]OGY34656.1 MAG: hypothetical protein A3D99_04940 [Candidatus Andersenbacteria bacterium RIFCSPHIGHO2_12_FULL_45_11]OGY34729.1 MAG: hypothetical protein A3C02_02310 [Candidatus Andersenbacteria bacterium RIFCSPHIGHO2_02_FULL_45_11]
MNSDLTISAAPRSGNPGVIRRSGNIPAVLYGHGIDPQNMEVETRAFAKLFTAAGYTTMLTLSVADGKEHPVFIRDVRLHPIKNTITHIDFYQVRMDEAISANVPLKFVGEAPAVKNMSGIFVRNMDELEVEALPKDLPHDIEVDISLLDTFDAVIHVSDIKLPEGVKTYKEGTEVVALVQPPRSEQEIEALSAEVKEDVESVEGVKKEEPAEGEAPEGAEGKETKKDEKKSE